MFIVSGAFIWKGVFTINPGDAVLLMIWGEYKGTIKQTGVVWTSPFNTHIKVSTKYSSLNGQIIKVNDKTGNPIMIGITAVYKVDDTFKALFDVNSYETFVQVQSEAALRSLASQYSYDICNEDDNELLTLRGGKAELSKVLVKELQERLNIAGIKIFEAKISHLSYAREIAETMLKR